jgi:hypothetical protein
MNKEEIFLKIKEARPNLPEEEVLNKITFNWNKEGLSTWDGGYDLNEKLREEVVELLEEEFRTKNPDYAKILRFLLRQEIENCSESEASTQTLRISYDRLADLEFYEDIPLLLSANDDTSFDAHCSLYKNRLFYKGYENVMKYLKSNEKIDEEIIERIQYYAEYFGYDKEAVKDEDRG